MSSFGRDYLKLATAAYLAALTGCVGPVGGFDYQTAAQPAANPGRPPPPGRTRHDPLPDRTLDVLRRRNGLA